MPVQNLQSNLDNTDEEILIKDESGSFKLYSHGHLRDYQEAIPRRGSGQGRLEAGVQTPVPSIPQPQATNLPIDTGMEEPMLQPPPPVVRKETASFYFHPEDEEDVAKIKSNISGLATGKRYSLDKIFKRVSDVYQLTLNDLLKSRLRNIIYSYLRDRRTLIDFQEALLRPEIEGGMNFVPDQAEKIVHFLKEIKDKVEAEGGLVMEEGEVPQTAGKRPAPLAQPAPSATKPIPKLEQTPLGGNQKLKTESEAQAAAQPIASDNRAIFRRPFKKDKMSDVKRDYRLYGPVEELGSLDLATFRRLGGQTAERAEKVIKKIENLAQDSLLKKAAGLKAWRSSPLYKMYLAVGQAGMEYNLAVSKIIEQYQQAGKEILAVDEFETISDINKKLRY